MIEALSILEKESLFVVALLKEGSLFYLLTLQ